MVVSLSHEVTSSKYLTWLVASWDEVKLNVCVLRWIYWDQKDLSIRAMQRVTAWHHYKRGVFGCCSLTFEVPVEIQCVCVCVCVQKHIK